MEIRAKLIVTLGFMLIALTIMPMYYHGVTISADQQQVSWRNAYSSNFSGSGNAILQAEDGGFLVTGNMSQSQEGDSNVTLLKTNANGSLLWQKSYGGDKDEHGNSITRAAGGGYVIAGDTESYGNGSSDVYLVKTDHNGDMQWERTFGGDKADAGLAIQQSSDGGYLIAGYTESSADGKKDIYLIKTNAAGDLQWSRTYGGPYDDMATSIQRTRGDSYIISGYYGVSNDRRVAYLLHIDNLGKTIWARRYDTQNDSIAYGVRQSSDRGYVAVGYTIPDKDRSDILLFKVAPDGNLTWMKHYRESALQYGYNVFQMPDNGYTIIGGAGVMNPSVGNKTSYEGLMIRLDAHGNVRSRDTYEAEGDVFIRAGIPAKEGGFALTGAIGKNGNARSSDIYLIKTEPS
jgi:hypothetical protein